MTQRLQSFRDRAEADPGARGSDAGKERKAKKEATSHIQITLKPLNPDFQPIVLTGADEGQLQVVAELAEVLQ